MKSQYSDIIPIECNEKMLTEYGRAHLWINQADYWLGTFIDYDARTDKNKTFIESCHHLELGKKIRKCENDKSIPITTNLLNQLKELNEKRNTITHHGVTILHDLSSGISAPAIIKDRGKHNDIKIIKTDDDFMKILSETVELAKNIICKLRKAIVV